MNYSPEPFNSVSVIIQNLFDFFSNPVPPAQSVGDLEMGLTPLPLPKLAAGVYQIHIATKQGRFSERLQIMQLDGHTRQNYTVTRMKDGRVFKTPR
jgi:hypothetical protein